MEAREGKGRFSALYFHFAVERKGEGMGVGSIRYW